MGLGSASLDTKGGLVTLAPAIDLPEGASPRCWDCDFAVGAVRSRDGLSSFYTYTTTLSITGYTLRYGIATFTYVGSEPTTNEGFLLSGFTGNQSYLNGLEVFVETAGMTTFTAASRPATMGQYRIDSQCCVYLGDLHRSKLGWHDDIGTVPLSSPLG